MSELAVDGLRVAVAGKEILCGVDLTVRSGEVIAVMGPNGSGKSTLASVIAGRPGYEVLAGSVRIDDTELLGMTAWQRAEAGLFLAMQYPTEVPGVSLRDVLTASRRTGSDPEEVYARMAAEAERIGFSERFLSRPLNVDLSGGEKKRNEVLQLGLLRPRFAVIDEIDSGLDLDALHTVGARIEQATEQDRLGVLAITHYSRFFRELRPDVVHVLVGGRIQRSGGADLAAQLERTGYLDAETGGPA